MNQRNWLIPVKTWSFDKMARFGENFHKGNKQKITLNFALSDSTIVESKDLLSHFNSEDFLIKITPVNPTYNAQRNNLDSSLSELSKQNVIIDNLKNAGYEVIVSIGDLTENEIGSNCGQHVMNYLKNKTKIKNSYTFPIHKYLI